MTDFGKFMAEKLKRINPDKLPSATVYAWFTPESYPKVLALLADHADRPRTFEEWLLIAEYKEKELRHAGIRVVRAEVEPIAFLAFCRDNGFQHVDSKALTGFASWKAQEILRLEMGH